MRDIIKYGDWRDDVLNMGIELQLETSRFASPVCPSHGSRGIRKKKISVWQCNYCDFQVTVSEEMYRAWLDAAIKSGHSAMPPLSEPPRLGKGGAGHPTTKV